MPFKAVIFDMDGVLIDSEKYWVGVGEEFFDRHNIVDRAAITQKIRGRSEADTARILQEEIGLKESAEEIIEERTELSEKIYTNLCEPMRGAQEMLERIYENDYLIGLASSTSKRRINNIIKRFGWEKYFKKIVSAEELSGIGKPDPAIYLKMAKELEVEPKDCLVFEDTANGLSSAKRAGMTCVLIKQEWSTGDLSKADLIVSSFEEQEILKFLGV